MPSLCSSPSPMSMFTNDIDIEEYLGFIGLERLEEMLVVLLLLTFRGVLTSEGLGSKRFGIFSPCFLLATGDSFSFSKKLSCDRDLASWLVGLLLDLE